MGLICDGATSRCRNDPPQMGEPCGIGVDCAAGLACSDAVGTCVAPRQVGEECFGIGQGNCDTALICDGGSGLCRNDPPQIGQACGELVQCDGSLPCIDGVCAIPASADEACNPLQANSCIAGLVCEAATSLCRHDPPLIGESCNALVSCPAGTLCIQQRCRSPGAANEPCEVIDPASCQTPLVCDLGTSLCRHTPPLEGESCGGSVLCVAGQNLTCLNSTCVQRGELGDVCDSNIGNSCIDGLICDVNNDICRNPISQLGEVCSWEIEYFSSGASTAADQAEDIRGSCAPGLRCIGLDLRR